MVMRHDASPKKRKMRMGATIRILFDLVEELFEDYLVFLTIAVLSVCFLEATCDFFLRLHALVLFTGAETVLTG
jgi:hypothetical protein